MSFLRACLMVLSFLFVVPNALGQERTKQETWATLTMVETDELRDEVLFLRGDHGGAAGLWVYEVGQAPARRCDVAFEDPKRAWSVTREDSEYVLALHERGGLSLLNPVTGESRWRDGGGWLGHASHRACMQFVPTPDDPESLGILV